MTKTLRDLIPIERVYFSRTGKKEFVRKGEHALIPSENIEILKYEPVLLREFNSQYSLVSPSDIPQEANAFLKGETVLSVGGRPAPICSASYCRLGDDGKKIKRYRLKECMHRICDCEMVESPNGEYFKEIK